MLRQDFENKARTDKNTGFKYDSKQHEKEVKEIKDFREMPAEPSHQSEEKSYCIMD